MGRRLLSPARNRRKKKVLPQPTTIDPRTIPDAFYKYYAQLHLNFMGAQEQIQHMRLELARMAQQNAALAKKLQELTADNPAIDPAEEPQVIAREQKEN
jgi:hypothetical protein